MPKTKAFIELKNAVKKEYLRKSVPMKYKKVYGARYGKEDVKRLSFAIAKSRGIKIH